MVLIFILNRKFYDANSIKAELKHIQYSTESARLFKAK